MALFHSGSAEKIKYELIDKVHEIDNAIKDVEGSTLIAVDLEGVSLSRTGPVTLLAVSTESRAYLFDVHVLGKQLFTDKMKEILEHRSKLMFDCRNDSDALYHQFGVRIGNVIDLQLMEVLFREANSKVNLDAYERDMSNLQPNRILRTWYIYMSGLNSCIRRYLNSYQYEKIKGCIDMVKEGSDFWAKRPLSDNLLQYASVDVLSLFQLYEKFKIKCLPASTRLKVASDRYIKLNRDKKENDRDHYPNIKAKLPLEIIPPPKGETSSASHLYCDGCQRNLPSRYFASRRRGEVGKKYCAVCQRAIAEEK